MDFTDGISDLFLPGFSEAVLSCCDMCGEKHDTADCLLLENVPKIVDSVTSRARVTLPSVLSLRIHLDSTVSVTCVTDLETGTMFGPMVAPRSETITNHQFPIKVFSKGDEPDHYFDVTDENQCNWMCLVVPSAEPHQQNLSCLQIGLDIFFLVRQTVPAGTELRVWYSPFYAQKLRHTLTRDLLAPASPAPDVTEVVLIRDPQLGAINQQQQQQLQEGQLPVPLLRETDPRLSSAQQDGQHQQDVSEVDVKRPASPDDRWPCVVCGHRCANESSLAGHLLSEHSEHLQQTEPTTNCPICQKHCLSPRTVVQHLRKHRGDFACKQCHKKFTRRDALQAHPCPGASRAAEGCVCPHCGRLFTNAEVWRRHVQRHTTELQCQGCRRSFGSAAALSGHTCRAQLSEQQLLQCRTCHKRFPTNAGLAQHVVLHSPLYSCHLCQRRFSGPKALRCHRRTCGATRQLATEGAAACRDCQLRFTSLAALTEHVRQHELPHGCSVCGQRYRTQLQLKVHVCTRLARQPSPRPRPRPAAQPAVCEVCAQRFNNRKALWLHKFTHAERQFKCPICPMKFKRKDTMVTHMARHSTPQVPCPYCDKRFKSKKSLGVHVKLHTGDARFVCDVCDKRFVQKVNMLRHKATHDPEHKQINKCDDCGKCFNGKHHLEEHRLEHTQGRALKCPACPRKFVKRSELLRHQTASHATSQYECPYCSMTTKLKASLSRHLSRTHVEQRAEWSAPGFIESLYRSTPAEDALLTLEPNSTLLLALPPAGDPLEHNLSQSPPGLLADSANEDVLLYVLNVQDDLDVSLADQT